MGNAIVWQCRRTAALCDRLKADGAEPEIRRKTGLVVDAYFSGTKIRWMLDHDPALRPRAERGELCFGTVDAWLLWQLTGGAVHATDPSNASRTLCFDIHRRAWDEGLCRILGVPMALLPEVKPSAGVFGETRRLARRSRRRAERIQRVVRVARRHSGGGHRGRPAGRALRPGLRRARHGQEHLRHRLLRAAEHGRARRRLRPRAC